MYFRFAGLIYFVLWIGSLATATAGLSQEITDQLGRRLTVPDSPRRVVALAPSITEIVFALEQQHRLVGVSRYSDYPTAAQKIYKIGPYVNPDIERIVALNPELCIAIKDGNPYNAGSPVGGLAYSGVCGKPAQPGDRDGRHRIHW